MKAIAGILLIFTICFGNAAFADEFTGVRCGADIPKALIGQEVSGGRVVEIESKYKNLGLKDLGSSEVNDYLSETSWLICGKEFDLLTDNVVRDVMESPAHSKVAPEVIEICKINGKLTLEVIEAILIPKEGAEDFPASMAWKIDEKTKRFMKIPTAGLTCPKIGIITADGGL